MVVSPVKVFQTRRLNIQSYTWLICGKIAGKDILRKSVEQGIQNFIYAFNIRKTCNGFYKQDFSEFVDFENESWIRYR